MMVMVLCGFRRLPRVIFVCIAVRGRPRGADVVIVREVEDGCWTVGVIEIVPEVVREWAEHRRGNVGAQQKAGTLAPSGRWMASPKH